MELLEFVRCVNSLSLGIEVRDIAVRALLGLEFALDISIP